MTITKESKNNKKTLAELRKSTNTYSVTEYDFPQKDVVPAGEYTATIDRIREAKTNGGKDAYDTFFTLKGESGQCHRVKQRTVASGFYFRQYLDQLADVGMDENNVLTEIEGVEVIVDLIDAAGGCANIKMRPSEEDLDYLEFDEDEE